MSVAKARMREIIRTNIFCSFCSDNFITNTQWIVHMAYKHIKYISYNEYCSQMICECGSIFTDYFDVLDEHFHLSRTLVPIRLPLHHFTKSTRFNFKRIFNLSLDVLRLFLSAASFHRSHSRCFMLFAIFFFFRLRLCDFCDVYFVSLLCDQMMPFIW